MPFFYVTFTREFSGYVKAKTRKEVQEVCSDLDRLEIEDMDSMGEWDVHVAQQPVPQVRVNLSPEAEIIGAVVEDELINYESDYVDGIADGDIDPIDPEDMPGYVEPQEEKTPVERPVMHQLVMHQLPEEWQCTACGRVMAPTDLFQLPTGPYCPDCGGVVEKAKS